MLLYKHILTMDARRSRSPESKALKTKLQIAHNKCICFCLRLPPRGHTNPSHFRKINWLRVEHRVELCTSTTVNTVIASYCLDDIFIQMALDMRQKSSHFFVQRSGIC